MMKNIPEAQDEIIKSLQKKTEHLAIINRIGIAINSSINKGVDDILVLVFEEISQVMDFTSGYIAFYDKEKDTLEFKLVIEDGKAIQLGPEWEPRKSGNGLTEHIIKSTTPVLITDMSNWVSKNQIDLIGLSTKSWLGVPIELGNNTIGAISVQSYKREKAFDDDDVQLLSLIATHIATAMENARILAEARANVAELEKTKKYLQDAQNLAIIGLLYGEDLHLANNRLGAAQQFAKNIIEYADDLERARNWAQKIERNIGAVLNVIQEMRNTVNPPNPIRVNVGELISSILNDISIPSSMLIKKQFDSVPDLTLIAYDRQLGQVFRVVFHNAIDAMEGEGALTITIDDFISDDQPFIKVSVLDTGRGIPKQIQENIFSLGRKQGKGGFGMGLAWSRLFLQMSGGDLRFQSTEGKGTIVTIIVPKDVTAIKKENLLHKK